MEAVVSGHDVVPQLDPDRRAALNAAFHLVEDVQTPAVEQARRAIREALTIAEHAGWPETIATLMYAEAVDAITNLPDLAAEACRRLIERSEALSEPAMLAAGLTIRAELALRDGDVVRHGADCARALVLLDTAAEPISRASALISAGVSYEALSLWELGDELYTRAELLLPECDDQLLRPVIELNRGLAWFWWTAALLEAGETERAEQLLRDRTEDPTLDLPASWALELRVSRLARLTLLNAADPTEIEELRELGARLDLHYRELEWLARMQVHLALAHDSIRTGRLADAAAQAAAAEELTRIQGTVYQRSFAHWTATLVEQRQNPDIGQATRTYASVLARQRWDERLGRLAAAREQIESERLRGQHEGLVRRTLEDPLTGLGNRRALEQRLDRDRAELADDGPVAMLIVDVDEFKAVNDAYGHAVGDQVLCRVGEILRSVLRTDDLALRLGGDEFCAVVTGAPADAVQQRADQIGALVLLEGWSAIQPGLQVSVSVGLACARGPAGVDDLYPRADAALYAAKAAGSGLQRIAH